MNASFLIFKVVYCASTIHTYITQLWVNVYGAFYVRFPRVHSHLCRMYSRGLLLRNHLRHFVYTQILGLSAEPLESEWSMIAHMEPFDIYGKSRLVEHYHFRQNMDKAELINIANIQCGKIETRDNTNAEYLQIVKFNNIK